MNSPFTPSLLELINENSRGKHRPLLFGNARIITNDSLIGDFDRGDVLLGGGRVVGIGPGLLSAADDDGAIVIDCDGYVIVPLVVDIASIAGLRSETHRAATALTPGNPASFAILAVGPEKKSEEVLHRFLDSAQSAHAIVIDGNIAAWGGCELTDPSPSTRTVSDSADATSEWLGTWIDESNFVHQHLTADGRYDETRGGREHAFAGDFWINGDRIDYRDDLGFWAFGEFRGNILQHAGYTFHRS